MEYTNINDYIQESYSKFKSSLDKVELNRQLLLDQVFYGNSFHTLDKYGFKKRIDPMDVFIGNSKI